MVLGTFWVASVQAQSTSAPNLFNVLSWSSVFNQTVYNGGGTPVGELKNAVPNIFAYQGTPVGKAKVITGLFQSDTSIVNLNNAINTNIATALGASVPVGTSAAGLNR